MTATKPEPDIFHVKKPTTYLGKNIFHLATCTSTQTVLKALLQDGQPVGSIVIADQQTQGRGQHGKQWIDTGLSQLFCSISLRPTLPSQQLPILNLATALIAIDVLQRSFAVTQLAVKWPNDIYLRQGKLGGIISEILHHDKQTILLIGMGINFGGTSTKLPSSIRASATTLFDQGYEIDQTKFLHEFIYTLEQHVHQDASECIDWIVQTFANLNLHQSQTITVTDNGQVTTGIAGGIDQNGRLLLTTENNDKIAIATGHIHMNN